MEQIGVHSAPNFLGHAHLRYPWLRPFSTGYTTAGSFALTQIIITEHNILQQSCIWQDHRTGLDFSNDRLGNNKLLAGW